MLGLLMSPCPRTPLLWGDAMARRSPLKLPRLWGGVVTPGQHSRAGKGDWDGFGNRDADGDGIRDVDVDGDRDRDEGGDGDTDGDGITDVEADGDGDGNGE